ncbi:MAG: FAD-dependent oxidoreductase, partial [Pseudomonadota bacterium]
MQDNTIIIGAGQAAARCAIELRRLGYSGQITLYGAESEYPYQRPELSKSYLARAVSAAELNVLSEQQAAALDIEVVLNAAVTDVDTHARTIEVNDTRVPFDKLVFACGGKVRQCSNALSLRTLQDAETLYSALRREQQLTVIGGGWLGLEVAATARAHGLQVTLYERQSRLGARVLPTEISDVLLRHQQRIGVEVRLGSELADAASTHGIVCACVGITANDALAWRAGIDTDNGILVNNRQMTSVPNIFAVGDCAREQGMAAMENWAYANVSAERAAHAICDIAPPVSPDLWIWSKQGDLLLQMRGQTTDASQCIVRHSGESSAYFYLNSADQLTGCIA